MRCCTHLSDEQCQRQHAGDQLEATARQSWSLQLTISIREHELLGNLNGSGLNVKPQLLPVDVSRLPIDWEGGDSNGRPG